MKIQLQASNILVALALSLSLNSATLAETYNYDLSGRLIGVVYADASTIGYSFNANGNLLALTSKVKAPPVVVIVGGSRTIADTNGVVGEPVLLVATATDTGGTIQSTQWLINDAVVATGILLSIPLPDGQTIVTFKATDNDGDFSTAMVTVTIEAPLAAEVPPSVAIVGGNRTISDTDGVVGESVALAATATDSDGTIQTTQWLINDAVVATGLSSNIALPDGDTIITFKAIDNEGNFSTATVTITIESPPLGQGWPVPYSGITPAASLGLMLNNISALNPQDGRIYSCLRILSNGTQSSFQGVDRYDIAFEILSATEGTIGAVLAKPFNATGALNENGELPDCSGSFDLVTNIYEDIIHAGTQVFSIKFALVAGPSLAFRVSELSLVGVAP